MGHFKASVLSNRFIVLIDITSSHESCCDQACNVENLIITSIKRVWSSFNQLWCKTFGKTNPFNFMPEYL